MTPDLKMFSFVAEREHFFVPWTSLSLSWYNKQKKQSAWGVPENILKQAVFRHTLR